MGNELDIDALRLRESRSALLARAGLCLGFILAFFLLAGPLGAFAGALIGIMLDELLRGFIQRRAIIDFLQGKKTFLPKTFDPLVVSCVALLACVMGRAKWASRPEKAFSRLAKSLEAGTLAQSRLVWDTVKGLESLDPQLLANYCALYIDRAAGELCDILIEAAFVGGSPEGERLSGLESACGILGLGAKEFERRIEANRASYLKTDEAREEREYLEACVILGLSPDSGPGEAKKAYRTLAMDFHPDTMSALGEAQKEGAKEAFLKIEKAFRLVSRGRPSRYGPPRG